MTDQQRGEHIIVDLRKILEEKWHPTLERLEKASDVTSDCRSELEVWEG